MNWEVLQDLFLSLESNCQSPSHSQRSLYCQFYHRNSTYRNKISHNSQTLSANNLQGKILKICTQHNRIGRVRVECPWEVWSGTHFMNAGGSGGNEFSFLIVWRRKVKAVFQSTGPGPGDWVEQHSAHFNQSCRSLYFCNLLMMQFLV